MLGLHLGNTDAGNDPTSQTTRRAYDLLAQGFGQGFSGPAARRRQAARAPATRRRSRRSTGRACGGTPGVAAVAPPRLSPSGDVATISAYPTTSPQSTQTEQLVKHLRRDVIPPLEQRSRA